MHQASLNVSLSSLEDTAYLYNYTWCDYEKILDLGGPDMCFQNSGILVVCFVNEEEYHSRMPNATKDRKV